MRYRIALGLSFLVSTSIALAAPFADVRNHEFAVPIDVLWQQGIMKGYPDGTFKPDRPVNRAEMLKILMYAVYGNAGGATNVRCFRDFVGTEQWYWATACKAKELGIVQGYPDGTFRGDAKVITAEALKMAMTSWDMPLPVYIRAPDHWYDPYMDAASGKDVFLFLPRSPTHILSRGEVAQMILSLGGKLATVQESSSSLSSKPSSSSSSKSSSQSSASSDPFPLPLMQGALLIEQVSTGSSEAPAGAKNVPLLAFRATSARQDVVFQGFKLRAETGNVTSVSKYTLYIDTNGDGTAELSLMNGVVRGSIVEFSGIGYMLQISKMTKFEVRGDFPAGVSGNSVSLGFATSDLQFITAQGAVDGKDLSPGIEIDTNGCPGPYICRIAVHTLAGRVVSVTELGNLYVFADPATAPSHQLLLGETSDVVERLKLRATGEDISITQLSIGGGSNSISALELYVEGSAKPFATARTVTCDTPTSGLFCAKATAGMLTIQKDHEVKVQVRALVQSDAEGGTSGETFAPTLSALTTTPAVKALGKQSGKDLSQNDGDSTAEGEIFIGRDTNGANATVTGNTHDLVAARISSMENASIDSDNTPVPSGTATIGVFRFRAATNKNTAGGADPVILTKLVFTLTASNVQIEAGSVALFNKANANVTTPCSTSSTTGTITVTCQGLDGSGVATAIDSGGSIELGLRANIVITKIALDNVSILQLTLGQLGNRSLPGTVTWKDSQTSFQWVDSLTLQVKSTMYKTQ